MPPSRALSFAIVVLSVVAPANAAPAPKGHGDPADAAGSPLDVRSAAFGQRDLDLWLRIRTTAPWRTRDLGATGRRLCLELGTGTPAAPAGRLCLAAGRRDPVVRFQPPAGTGVAAKPRWRGVPAVIERPDQRSVIAAFRPSALPLPLGPVTWRVASRWPDRRTCGTACDDSAPDTGAFALTIGVLGQPPCFGAAARDPLDPCGPAELPHGVTPSPVDAPLIPDAGCRLLPRPRGAAFLHPCAFGVTGAQRTGTFALIGDSHARHWRSALDVVAEARRWRGVSITRPGCPFSTQIPSSSGLGPGACAQLHREILAWLRANGQIDTIFVSAWAEPPSGPQGGTGGYGGGAASFGAMLDRVPRSVRTIYILRDVPGARTATPGCVLAARHAHHALARACALPRSAVLTPDPEAAASAGRSRVHVIDLTRHFCGARSCSPVVGGVYVYKDDNHMNGVFSTTLGPFVLRALSASS